MDYTNLIKKNAQFLYLACLGFLLIILYQNCASEGGNIFPSTECTSESCISKEDANLLSISAPSSLTIALPQTAAPNFTNLNVTGTCNNGNFRKNIIRWQLTTTTGQSRAFGVTTCENVNGSLQYTVRRFLDRSQLAAGTYTFRIGIYGISNFNREVRGPKSDSNPITVVARETIPAPLLRTVSTSGTLLNDEWEGRDMRIISSSNPINTSRFATGLCKIQSSNNIVRLTLKTVNSNNHIQVDYLCRPLSTSVGAYDGFFAGQGVNNSQVDIEISPKINNADFEGCGSTPSPNPRCIFTTAGNRIFDIRVSQTDNSTSQSILVEDFRRIGFVFNNTLGAPINSILGKGWNINIMFEVFNSIKSSLLLVDEPGILQTLASSEVLDMDRIFSNQGFDYDLDPNMESFSTRRWMLGRLSIPLGESRNSAQAPMKIQVQDNIDFINNLYKNPSGNTVINGVLCGLTQTNSRLEGLTSIDTSIRNLHLQRIALCLASKIHGNMYLERDILNATREGVRFTGTNQCQLRISGKNLSTVSGLNSSFCQTLASIYNQLLVFSNAHMPTDFNTATETQRLRITEAIIQFYINTILEKLANDPEISRRHFNQVLTSLSLNHIITANYYNELFEAIRPKERNFILPNNTPVSDFAAYTAFNSPGSATTTGSY